MKRVLEMDGGALKDVIEMDRQHPDIVPNGLEPRLAIQIASVMHTGTHFLMWEVFRDWQHWGGNRERSHDKGYYVTHLEYPLIEHVVGAHKSGVTVVCPVRHPLPTAQSWRNRGRDLRIMAEQFDRLASFNGVAWFVPVDAPSRDLYLRGLADHLGEELTTTWPVVRYDNDGPFTYPLNREEVGIVMDIVDKHASFFDQFGYGKE